MIKTKRVQVRVKYIFFLVHLINRTKYPGNLTFYIFLNTFLGRHTG